MAAFSLIKVDTILGDAAVSPPGAKSVLRAGQAGAFLTRHNEGRRGGMQRKILIMGLPGAGKTTLAREVASLLRPVLFNADEVRKKLNRDLGFPPQDRIERARRIGWLCKHVAEAGHVAIADFICPTPETLVGIQPCLYRLARMHQGRPLRRDEPAVCASGAL